MSEKTEFAVSDQNGNYVFFTNDLSEAQDQVEYIDASLAEAGEDGSAAIMRKLDGEEGYELYL